MCNPISKRAAEKSNIDKDIIKEIPLGFEPRIDERAIPENVRQLALKHNLYSTEALTPEEWAELNKYYLTKLEHSRYPVPQSQKRLDEKSSLQSQLSSLIPSVKHIMHLAAKRGNPISKKDAEVIAKDMAKEQADSDAFGYIFHFGLHLNPLFDSITDEMAKKLISEYPEKFFRWELSGVPYFSIKYPERKYEFKAAARLLSKDPIKFLQFGLARKYEHDFPKLLERLSKYLDRIFDLRTSASSITGSAALDNEIHYIAERLAHLSYYAETPFFMSPNFVKETNLHIKLFDL